MTFPSPTLCSTASTGNLLPKPLRPCVRESNAGDGNSPLVAPVCAPNLCTDAIAMTPVAPCVLVLTRKPHMFCAVLIEGPRRPPNNCTLPIYPSSLPLTTHALLSLQQSLGFHGRPVTTGSLTLATSLLPPMKQSQNKAALDGTISHSVDGVSSGPQFRVDATRAKMAASWLTNGCGWCQRTQCTANGTCGTVATNASKAPAVAPTRRSTLGQMPGSTRNLERVGRV